MAARTRHNRGTALHPADLDDRTEQRVKRVQFTKSVKPAGRIESPFAARSDLQKTHRLPGRVFVNASLNRTQVLSRDAGRNRAFCKNRFRSEPKVYFTLKRVRKREAPWLGSGLNWSAYTVADSITRPVSPEVNSCD